MVKVARFQSLRAAWIPLDTLSLVYIFLFCLSSLNSISSDESKRHSVKSMGSDSSSSGPGSLLTVDMKNFKALWNEEVYQNRERWKTQAAKGIVQFDLVKIWWFMAMVKLICPNRSWPSPQKIGLKKLQCFRLIHRGVLTGLHNNSIGGNMICWDMMK